MKQEIITADDIHRAYFSCLIHKRNKKSALEYEQEYEMNNYLLRQELNNGSYEIGKSICFCVTWPKLREVFAASFKDRVVHHLLMMKTLHFFEDSFINESYSCRVGKGVLYGVNDMQRQISEIGKDCWYVKLDMEGFFMSIDKNILWEKIERIINENWTLERDGDNKDYWMELMKKVVLHRPELNCEKHGNPNLFEQLPPHKTLFKANGKGLPIGNLTSQILANFYLSDIDHWMKSELHGYGRYVDDLVMLGSDIGRMKKMINRLRNRLAELNVKLNEHKTIIQRADKGLLFTGYILKPWGIYAGKRLVNAAFKASHNRTDSETVHLNRINSYLGFLRHSLSYGIRHDITSNTMLHYNMFKTNPSITKLVRMFPKHEIEKLNGSRNDFLREIDYELMNIELDDYFENFVNRVSFEQEFMDDYNPHGINIVPSRLCISC